MKFAIGASVVALALVGAADAADLHVPAQYPTIQAAVNAAVTGDVVLVAPGTWAGFSSAGKSLTVRSLAGFAVTRINTGITTGVVASANDPSPLALKLIDLTVLSTSCINSGGLVELDNVRFVNASFSSSGTFSGVSAKECEFVASTLNGAGQGLRVFTDCAIRNNNAPWTIQDLSIWTRTQFDNCAGVMSASAPVHMHDCVVRNSTLAGTSTTEFGGAAIDAAVSVTCTGSVFINCQAKNSTPMAGSSPRRANGGAIRSSGSVSLVDCEFRNCEARVEIYDALGCSANSGIADSRGGAVYAATTLSATNCVFENCKVRSLGQGNQGCGGYDSAILVALGGAVASGGVQTLSGCVISASSSAVEIVNLEGWSIDSRGGGAFSAAVGSTMTNCSFVFNSAQTSGGAVSGTSFVVEASQFRLNSSAKAGAIHVVSPSSATTDVFIRGSLFVGNVGVPRALLTSTTPLALAFLSDCAFCGSSELECDGYWFEKGVNLFEADCVLDCDLDGLPDSYELSTGLATDCNANGIPDNCDADSGGSDCNANGIPDSCDIAGGAADCNANGIPDSCESDCDGDGVPNACEIASGAPDCDANGVPDACQADCDDDGLIDVCEIATGSADCNSNAIPDSCEIASGASTDFNKDGVIDACQPDMQFAGLELEIVPITNRGLDDLFPSTAVCYRLYAKTTQSASAVLGLFGNASFPMSITATGGFWQSPSGGDLASEVPCDLSGMLPSARFDSWLTIGLPCASGNSAQNTGLDLSAFNKGGGINDNDGIVFVQPGFAQSIAGDAKRVLLAQLTTNEAVLPSGLIDVVGRASNGVGDWIAYGQSIPTPALVDCNGNGQQDAFDIALGTALDCDQSGVPDSCEYGSATTDCNMNGISDLCDVVSAFSSDLNGNFVPDECECSGDVDGNGRVDVDDIIDVITSWGDTGNSLADVNNDNVVDAADLVIVLAGYGSCL